MGNKDQSRRPLTTPPVVFLMTESLEAGGSERQFAALARTLDPAAFRAILGCIRRTGDFAEGLGEIAEFRLGGSLYGIRSIRSRFRLGQHLRRSRAAIAHAFDFYTNLSLIPAARLAGTPVVIGSQRQLGDLLTPGQARAQDVAFRWCDSVACNSQAAAARLVQRGLDERKIAVIHNGLAAEFFEPARPALLPNPGVLRVGMIAGMRARYKNHVGFLRAAARLAGRAPNVEFLLVGDGPLRPELEREAADLGLGQNVRFLGERRDIAAVLACLELSVLPSISEGLSNVILESLAAGVPVVAPRVGGNPELVVDGVGLLTVPGDDEALAAAMAQLLEDAPLREQFAHNARRFALDNFTLDRMRLRYQELYTSLLERKNWRPKPASLPRVAGYTGAGRLRVAIVAPSLGYVGGQSVQADLMARHWQDDPEVAAKVVHVDPPFPAGLGWASRVPFLRTMIREPLYLVKVRRELREADVAHIFSASYWSFLLAPAPALMIARALGKATLINYRSGEARDHLRRFRTALPVLRRADRLVVPSQYLVDVFREFGLKAEVVPNIVDLDQFSFRLRQPLRPRLICTRGFHPYYSVDVVVRAFAEVKRLYPDATLSLAGGGPLEPEIRKLARSLSLEGVEFAGAVSRRHIGRLYDQSDIFINASWLDNTPISILEAFACGTPVVSTAPESIRYLVENGRTGLLAEVGDWRSLSENVVRLLREPELAASLARQAYEQSLRYRWAAVRGQWLAVYRSLGGESAAVKPVLSPMPERTPQRPGFENAQAVEARESTAGPRVD